MADIFEKNAKFEIKGVTKDYGSSRGVFNLNLCLTSGEVLGFLGPNGAGKTTTIRMLMGFVKPDEGSLMVDGMNCFKQASKIHENLGYLPGELALVENMKGLEALKFYAGLKKMKSLDRMYELIDYFELGTDIPVKKMSKGMKQKLGLTVAFMSSPKLIILDEPTTGLDPIMQKKFIELIKKEKKRGTSIFMSSHVFEEIRETCDRIAIIKNGKLVALETKESIDAKQVKRYVITFEHDRDVLRFSSRVPQIKSLSRGKVIVSMEINSLIKLLANFEIKNLEIEESGLEEMFYQIN